MIRSLRITESNRKMMLWFSLYIGFSSVLLSSAELITSLPGQPPNVTFRQHSGYIVTDSQHGRALFYYFVEAEAPNPLSLPLTLWLNGGPGCSSLGFGAFMEHGPFQTDPDGGLLKNDYSWNLASNMLYVESPVGVGFSYSNTSSDYINWNDTTTALENLQFIINWFKEFPRYRDSDLYLTGESYAGHYIPQLATQILVYNKQPTSKPIKLKAIGLGNPLLDMEISVDRADYLWSHGVISDETLALKNKVCNDSRAILERLHGNVSKECVDVVERTEEEMGSFFDPGYLLRLICFSPSAKGQFLAGKLQSPSVATANDPCRDGYIGGYLNRHDVQAAMHANTTGLPYAWDFCQGPLKYDKKSIAASTIQTVSGLLRKHISVLLFSGDQDSKIPLTQTRIIANKLAKELKLHALGRYYPWHDGQQVGGWSQSFGTVRKGKNVTYLTFATVRGAAHEVPYTSPSQALTLFRSFLKGSPLPPAPN